MWTGSYDRFSAEQLAAIVCEAKEEFPSVCIDSRYGRDREGSVCGIYPDGSLYASPVRNDEGRVLLGNVFAEGLDAIYERFKEMHPVYHENYLNKISSDGTLG